MSTNDSNSSAVFTKSVGGLTCRKLDELDYVKKLRHWMRDDCWNPDGGRLYLNNTEISRSAVRMTDGHIERMPLLVGRPCFGIPIAFLRYRGQVRYTKARGLLPTGRCRACKAKEACASVVDRRLRSTPSITAAWIEWLQADGPAEFRKVNFGKSPARRAWNVLCRELARHPFMSVNDSAVVEKYCLDDQTSLDDDKKRQAKKRMQARRKGDVDMFDRGLLDDAARGRYVRLIAATFHPNCPRPLLRVRLESIQELCDVWLGREILRLEKKKSNAPSIARWIVDTERRNKSVNHAALATRVTRDLKRIAEFEQIQWDGGVLLPTLDCLTELQLIPDELIKAESGVITP